MAMDYIDTCSVIESFESVVSTYAQQLSLNETQTFATPSLTVVAVLVRINIKFHTEIAH
jgi:hypothetical protein